MQMAHLPVMVLADMALAGISGPGRCQCAYHHSRSFVLSFSSFSVSVCLLQTEPFGLTAVRRLKRLTAAPCVRSGLRGAPTLAVYPGVYGRLVAVAVAAAAGLSLVPALYVEALNDW